MCQMWLTELMGLLNLLKQKVTVSSKEESMNVIVF